MKKVILVLMALLLTASLAVAADFEGEVKFKNTNATDVVVLAALEAKFGDAAIKQYQVGGLTKDLADKILSLTMDELAKAGEDDAKGFRLDDAKLTFGHNMMRADGFEGGIGSMILDMKKNMMWIVQWEKESYIEIDINAILGMARQMQEQFKQMMEAQDGQSQQGKPELVKTGRTKTINKFNCREYTAYYQDQAMQSWIGPKAGAFEMMQKWQESLESMQMDTDMSIDLEDLLKEIDGMPILQKVWSGNSLDIQEVISIIKKKIAKSFFDIPKTFKKMTMGDMMMQDQ